MFTIRAASAAALLATTAVAPAGGQQQLQPVIKDFLASIGTGSKDDGLSRGDRRWLASRGGDVHFGSEEAAEFVAGRRFFKVERGSGDSLTIGRRVKAAFEQECAAKGGTAEDERSSVGSGFRSGRIATKLPDYFKSYGSRPRFEPTYWICTAGRNKVLGAVLLLLKEDTRIQKSNDLWLSVYALNGSGIRTAAVVEAESDEEQRRYQAERQREDQLRAEKERQNAAFQRELAIGTDTNCGTVIQVRGPMVEIAVPPGMRGPQEPATMWSKRELLFPYGRTYCGGRP